MKGEQILKKRLSGNFELSQIPLSRYTINYVKAGKGSPLILIHGANIGWGQWYRNLDRLSQYFTVYALDLPGSGFSSPLDIVTANFEKDFLETLEEFVVKLNLGEVSILGHSFGGWMALSLSVRSNIKVSRIVAANSLGFTDYLPWKFRPIGFAPFVKILTTKMMPINRENMKSFLQSVMGEEGKKNLEEDFVNYFSEAVSRTLMHPFWFIHRLSGRGRLREELVEEDWNNRINCPTLLLWGARDPLLPVSRQKFVVSGKFVSEIVDSGHVSNLEVPDIFNEKILSFLLDNK